MARAGTETRYHWGGAVGRNRANCLGCGSRWDGKQTAPVGSFSANGFGLHDVHGNVREWVEDCWHGNYTGAPSDGRAWTRGGDCSARVLRGGSWYFSPRLVRSANRLQATPPGYRDDSISVSELPGRWIESWCLCIFASCGRPAGVSPLVNSLLGRLGCRMQRIPREGPKRAVASLISASSPGRSPGLRCRRGRMAPARACPAPSQPRPRASCSRKRSAELNVGALRLWSSTALLPSIGRPSIVYLAAPVDCDWICAVRYLGW